MIAMMVMLLLQKTRMKPEVYAPMETKETFGAFTENTQHVKK